MRVAAKKERRFDFSTGNPLEKLTLLSEVVILMKDTKLDWVSTLTDAMKNLNVDARGLERAIEDEKSYMMLHVSPNLIRQIFNPIPHRIFLASQSLAGNEKGYCLRKPFIPRSNPFESLQEFVSALSNLLCQDSSESKLSQEERDELFNVILSLVWACIDEVKFAAFQPLLHAYVNRTNWKWVQWVNSESRDVWALAVLLLAEIHDYGVDKETLADLGVEIFNAYFRRHLHIHGDKIVSRRESPIDVRILLCLAGFGADAFDAKEFQESIARKPLTHGERFSVVDNQPVKQKLFSWERIKNVMSCPRNQAISTVKGKYFVSHNRIEEWFESTAAQTPRIHWFPVFKTDELSWRDEADEQATARNTPWTIIQRKVHRDLTSKLNPIERIQFGLERLEEFCFWKQSLLGTTAHSKCNRNCLYLDTFSTAYESSSLKKYLQTFYSPDSPLTFEQFHSLWFVNSRYAGETVNNLLTERLTEELKTIQNGDVTARFDHLKELAPWAELMEWLNDIDTIDLADMTQLFKTNPDKARKVLQAEFSAITEILENFKRDLYLLTPPLREEMQAYLDRDWIQLKKREEMPAFVKENLAIAKSLRRDIGYFRFLSDLSWGSPLNSKLLAPANNDLQETISEKNYEVKDYGLGCIIRSSKTDHTDEQSRTSSF